MTLKKVLVRKERKSRWERRTPLNPQGVATLRDKEIPVAVEACDYRIYNDETFERSGAAIVDKTFVGEVVLGIKEPKLHEIKRGQTHLAFSHTIKGQDYNMGLLKTFMERGCTLIDYEAIKDDRGDRVIAFGRYAGIAGAADTFWMAGRKLAKKKIASSLSQLNQTYTYGSVADLERAMNALAPIQGRALGILIVGTGNVGLGCEDVCRWLGLPRIQPDDVLNDRCPQGSWYAVLETADVNRHKDGSAYDRQEFREYGSERYASSFDAYLGKFDILLQAAYWEEMYPKHLDRDRMLKHKDLLPWAIGDVSCDIAGSLECTKEATTIEKPDYTYLVESDTIKHGVSWDGPTVMAVDNLPCELSKDASDHFSRILTDYVPEIAAMDNSKSFEECGLSLLLRDATIVYNGELTPNYTYLESYLPE